MASAVLLRRSRAALPSAAPITRALVSVGGCDGALQQALSGLQLEAPRAELWPQPPRFSALRPQLQGFAATARPPKGWKAKRKEAAAAAAASDGTGSRGAEEQGPELVPTKRGNLWVDSEPTGASQARVKESDLRRLHHRSLLSSQKDSKRQLLKAVGTAAVLGGGGLLAYRHLLEYLTVDALSAGVLAAGLAALAAGRQVQKRTAWPASKKPAKYYFQLLNDEVRFQKEREELNKLVGSDQLLGFPAEVIKRLSQAGLQSVAEKRELLKRKRELTAEDINRMLSEEGASYGDVLDMLKARVFVIDFCDRASPSRRASRKSTDELVREFGEKVSLVLSVATKHDRLVVKVTSPGGTVIDYGLAGSHMLRAKAAGVPVTACVDTVAASGGYMMACVADRVVAAPFAFLGSIGVVSQMINVHKVLKRNEVDALLFTAGKYKRTVTPFTETTQEAIDKMQHDIEDIHTAFKQHVYTSREELKGTIDEVATGETWLGMQAKELGLVDEIMTSEAYLRGAMVEYDVLLVASAKPKPSLRQWLDGGMEDAAAAVRSIAGGWLGAGLAPGLSRPTSAESFSLHPSGGLHDITREAQFRQP